MIQATPIFSIKPINHGLVDNGSQASRASFEDVDEKSRTIAVAAGISPLCPA